MSTVYFNYKIRVTLFLPPKNVALVVVNVCFIMSYKALNNSNS